MSSSTVTGERSRGQRVGGLMRRVQLSLYVPSPGDALLEAMRELFDALQRRLIPAHVTLCREDELAGIGLADLGTAFDGRAARPLTLRFGGPAAFQAHGVLLPCVEGAPDCHAVRGQLLGAAASRRLASHVTLAHPRNPRAPGNRMSNATVPSGGLTLTFRSVRLIEQVDSAPWRTLQEFSLHDP